MAKCLCQTADRLDPKRMRRSYRGRRRTAPSSRVAIYMNYYNEVRTHLSLGPRMLRLTCSSCRRSDSSEANSRWSPPRVRPDLICGRDKVRCPIAKAGSDQDASCPPCGPHHCRKLSVAFRCKANTPCWLATLMAVRNDASALTKWPRGGRAKSSPCRRWSSAL